MSGAGTLEDFLRRETAEALPAAITALAEAAKARHGAGVKAVLFYGSCLREGGEEGLADLYLLVERYGPALENPVSALGNSLLPPNVYYLETEFEGRRYRAKYALLSLDDFKAGCRDWFHSYIWARFAQPLRLGLLAEDALRDDLAAALAAAVRRTIMETLPLMPAAFTAGELWGRAFAETYRCELRAERPGRAGQLVLSDLARYQALTRLALGDLEERDGVYRQIASLNQAGAARRWARRRALGKLLSVLRLMKAAFTFRGGARYLAWKVERHSGQAVTLTPWQERHPILAAPPLLWRLYRKGAVR